MFCKLVVFVALRWEDECPGEASAVTNVIVSVVLGKIIHILTQQTGLFGIGQEQLGG